MNFQEYQEQAVKTAVYGWKEVKPVHREDGKILKGPNLTKILKDE